MAIFGDPSWLTTSPTEWPDFESHFQGVVPRQYPEDLYADDGEKRAQMRAFGTVMSFVKKATNFFVTRWFPRKDTTEEFLNDWAAVLAEPINGTLAQRQDRLIAKMRNRGTGTTARIQAMFARVFGIDDPTQVSFSSPDLTALPGGLSSNDHAELQSQMHIFNTGETKPVDRPLADALLARVVPSGDTWTVGQFDKVLFTTQSGFDIGTYT